MLDVPDGLGGQTPDSDMRRHVSRATETGSATESRAARLVMPRPGDQLCQ
jgi:hypothetical protein